MTEKTKIMLVSAVLVCICALLIFGISRILYKEPVKEPVNDGKEIAEGEIVIDLPNSEQLAVETSSELTDEQKIQEDSIIPPVPTEAPKLKEGEDITNKDKIPEYEETKPEEKPAESPVITNPDNNKGHEGEIYVEGFGWIKDSGEPSYNIYDSEMYVSGEKVGDM